MCLLFHMFGLLIYFIILLGNYSFSAVATSSFNECWCGNWKNEKLERNRNDCVPYCAYLNFYPFLCVFQPCWIFLSVVCVFWTSVFIYPPKRWENGMSACAINYALYSIAFLVRSRCRDFQQIVTGLYVFWTVLSDPVKRQEYDAQGIRNIQGSSLNVRISLFLHFTF